MKIKKLTPEQEARIDHYRDKWLDKIFKYQLFNSVTPEQVEKNMKALYVMCELAEPEVILVDSPYACQIKANELMRADGSITEDKMEYVPFSSYINYSDFSWLSFYDFFLNETDILEDFREDLEKTITFVDSSFMSIQLDKVCIVSRYPKMIRRNAVNNLHCVDGPAIEFADGYSQHYYNGVFIDEDIYAKLMDKTYSFEDFSKENNEEVKNAVLALFDEKYGSDYIYHFLKTNLEEINTFVDKKEKRYLEGTVDSMNIGVYTLFKGSVNNTEVAYVRCYCPSTDRMFFLGVDPEHTNAKDAIASLCLIPEKLIDKIESIRRQGEIFSVKYNEEGIRMLEDGELSQEDLANEKAVTGDIYFGKMTFEY